MIRPLQIDFSELNEKAEQHRLALRSAYRRLRRMGLTRVQAQDWINAFLAKRLRASMRFALAIFGGKS